MGIFTEGWWHGCPAPNYCTYTGLCQMYPVGLYCQTISLSVSFSPSTRFRLCVVRLWVGGLTCGGGRMSVCAMWVPVPPAIGHDLACLLWDLCAKRGQSLISYSLFTMDMLIRYLPWVPMRGYPCAALPWMPFGGGGLPGCLCASMLLLSYTWHQTVF
jgi:hypothetical protein